ncbi:unnamed protein product [Triticum turgidum subsp. durum]|uniref:Uncharacterized protein n=1 Tax=Triticum turgidum subsp. durum TaxID=4567 RepID=A0A9R0YE71_TRITD|nr:unnamed protein product [Triticum turgidum subsp. durum]
MPSPSLLLPLHLPPLRPRLASSSHSPRYPPPFLRTLSPPAPAPRLALPAAAARSGGGGDREGNRGAAGDRGRVIPIARCYEAGLARLEVSGAARREQAVAAAAAADGGAAAEAHLGAGSEAMVMEAFLPGAGGAASTRVILQAKEVKEKAAKIKKDFGDNIFSENEPDSDSILAMALKQVVMHKLSNYRLEIFSPGSGRNVHDWSKPRKVPVDFSISSSDGKLLSSLAEAIFSCVIEDTEKSYLGGTGGLFQTQKLNCSSDSTVCIHRISEAEVASNARRCLESFNLTKSSHQVGTSKNAWWPAPKYGRLAEIGGPDFVLWAHEFVPSYKLQINANAFENTKLEGCHELVNNRWEVPISHFQLVELGNVVDMYFEDQFTVPGKTFRSHWNAEPSKIRRNNGYLNNLFSFLAGSSVIFIVGIVAQLCWPQSLKGKRLFMGSSPTPSSHSYCSDVHSLDNSEVRSYCISIVKKIKDSCGCPGDIVVDENIGAWIGELPDCFKAINLGDNAASDDAQYSRTVIKENKNPLVLTPTEMTSHLETNDNSQESLQNIASFQVVMSEEGNLVGFQPTSRLAVNHWAKNPLAALLYEGRKLSPAFLEPRLKISRPAKVVPIELLMSVNSESFFALARPVQDPC